MNFRRIFNLFSFVVFLSACQSPPSDEVLEQMVDEAIAEIAIENELSDEQYLLGNWTAASCGLQIRIFGNEDELYYEYEAAEEVLSSSLTVIRENEEIYLEFEGIEWLVYPEGESSMSIGGVTALFEEGKFYIQNYGNAMNSYQVFEGKDCDKYLEFQKE